MTISLFDLTVPNYQQILGSTANALSKGKQYAAEHGIELSELVEKRLIEDMAPFRFQVVSVVHHSLGAMKGLESGEFTPPVGYGEPDYEGLEGLVNDAIEAMQAFDADTVNGWAGKTVVFKLGANELQFTAENFIQTFSFPNFHFHATTAYDLLRMAGVPLGKRDFLGAIRMGV